MTVATERDDYFQLTEESSRIAGYTLSSTFDFVCMLIDGYRSIISSSASTSVLVCAWVHKSLESSVILTAYFPEDK